MLRYKKLGTIVVLVIVSVFLLGSTSFGQLLPISPSPSYNTSWPLWSPTSDTVIGADTFTLITTELSGDTILPVLVDLTVSPTTEDMPYGWLMGMYEYGCGLYGI